MVGQVVGQAVQALRGQAGAEKFALSAGRGKTAFGKRRVGQRQRGKALGFEQGKVHRIAKGLSAQRFVAVGKAGLGEPHARGQVTEDLRIAAGLAQGCDGGAVEQHIGVAIGQVHVPVFELRGGGQDEIGVVGRVRLKMLQHHGEQVFARKALHHLAGIGRHGHRVAVVNHQGLDAGPESGRGLAQQVVTNLHHVERAWRARRHQVGPLQRCALRRKLA